MKGDGIETVDALEFLESAHQKSGRYDSRRHIVVAGGGNTAMDASRVAARLPGRPQVTILYRRTLAEMPADREEFEAAIADGVRYVELALPEAMVGGSPAGTLTVRAMELGEPDASGRRSPKPSASTLSLPCDLLVAAIGEMPDLALLSSLGVPAGKDGRPVADPQTMGSGVDGLFVAGDARRGPATIIAAIADGRKAATSVLRIAGIPVSEGKALPPSPDRAVLSRRGDRLPGLPAPREGEKASAEWIKREAERCLSCGSACLRCVEVCPNRANFALPVEAIPGSPCAQGIQILHVDELCNECGNCGFFCPYHGEPFAGKPTLFRDGKELLASSNAGFAFVGDAKSPGLVLRSASGSAPETLGWDSWMKTATASTAALILMARTVFGEHRYLIPGGKE
jgi:putative selenate reductase